MAKLEESKDFIENLLTTGIIGTDWPKKAYLAAVGKNRRGEVIWKKKYQTLPKRCGFFPNENHTERQMLDDQEFNKFLETGKVEEIILTSNYSPCKYCARDLINFYEEIKKLKLTIRFSHPYETREENHLEGLKDLKRAGITLEAMTEKSLLEVLEFMLDLDPGAVSARDAATRKKMKNSSLISDSEDEIILPEMGGLNFESDSD